MDLRQLECFVVVAEELHFGRAAERLHMTQPPLSRQIRLLEEHLGVALFIRANNAIRLTVAGQVLLGEARELLDRFDSVRKRVIRVGKGEEGAVTLGFTAGGAYLLMPGILAEAGRLLPQVRIELLEQPSIGLIERLREGSVDIALMRKVPADEDLDCRVLHREVLVAALPGDHPMAETAEVPITLFDDHPFIAYSESEGQHFHDLIAETLSRHNIVPRYVQRVGQSDALLGLIRIGMGAGIVPSSLRHLQPPGIHLKPIAIPPVEACMYVAWKRNNKNPALAALLANVVHYDRLE